MTIFIVELVIIILGLFAAALLFWRIPILPGATPIPAMPHVSIIIPARNEAETLPLLLANLEQQVVKPYEIIVADDESEDETAQIARSFGITVLSLRNKPAGWVGKSWACQQGALQATGDVFLFLDADVRLAPDGLAHIFSAYLENGTVSVQPRHMTQKPYEQCSLIFNLIQIAANGTALPKPVHLGLFGPIIAISRENYALAGGHEGIKSSVVEDMALADHLRQAGIPFQSFVGNANVSFRMYPAGVSALLQGFTKNLATGAAKTPAWLFLLVSLLLASVTSVAMHLILALARGEAALPLYGTLYLLWVMILFSASRKIGRYSPFAVALYPIPLIVFLLVFINSGIHRIFRIKVKWKGRAISLER
ncbi:MAG: glycosyltransferase family 2 protein [Christensenella sp.]|nr:glycosyltransferase family 2 protein [Christensenella sp.]